MVEIVQKYYLTTAIPYVNAAPHLGHTLEFVQTDVIARYQKTLGKDVQLITGADENSLKNVHAAEAKGVTPAELCERNAAVFKKMAEDIGLSFTNFQRTSLKESHWPGVQKLWKLCDEAGDIYKKKYRGLYCVGCESFYEESELPDGVCPEHNTKPEIVEEENYFFRLSKYQDKLLQLIESDELRILPETRKNEVLAFIKSGLQDFSVSRSVKRAKGWGVPVPGDESQIMYVWFDALGTYITGIGYGIDDKKFKRYWPADVHVIGKGILRFHAVYWPAILLSAGLELPKTIFVHGYITVNGQKMSKTLGNIVNPFSLIEKYGVDPIRYALLSEVPTFDDGDFSEKVMIEKNNNELVANIGNLVNRTMVFIANNFNSEIPYATLSDGDKDFLDRQKKQGEKITELLNSFRIKEGIDAIMTYSKNANKYFQDNEPWKKIKEDKTRAATVMYVLAHQVKDLAIMLQPYLPQTSASIFKQLNIEPQKWEEIGKLLLLEGHKIGKPELLFKKIEIKDTAPKEKEQKQKITFEDLDIEVGKIKEVKKHPNAEKLFIEKIVLSDGERQIVSGLVGHYTEDQLIGKKVLVFKNLAPVNIRGVQSQGMVLAVEDGNEVEVLSSDEWKIGDKAKIEGSMEKQKREINIKEFSSLKLEVIDHTAVADGKTIFVSGLPLKTKLKKGKIC
ncbi:MAG: methionine--tRNA ligase [Candidatus Bilamarchaeaceae archaeon]